MTSLTSSNIEDELLTLLESRLDVNIVGVVVSYEYYGILLREFYSHRSFVPFVFNYGSAISYNSYIGPLKIERSREMDEQFCHMKFKTNTGDTIYPLDEEINRILLGY
jgi:hypothetical protein